MLWIQPHIIPVWTILMDKLNSELTAKAHNHNIKMRVRPNRQYKI